MVKLEMTSGPFQGTLFSVITLNSESDCTCQEKNHFPVPLKYIDVTRATSSSLDVMLEKIIDDYWNVDGVRELSNTWTNFTRLVVLFEKPTGRVYLVWGAIDMKANDIQTRLFVARDMERHVGSVEVKRKAKVGYRKKRSLTMLENCVVFTSLNLMMRNSSI